MDSYALATRNTVEVVTDEELKILLEKPKKRVYSVSYIKREIV